LSARSESFVDLLRGDLEALRGRELAPVDVGVLDTGIDSTHPDLAGRVVESWAMVRGLGGIYRPVKCDLPGENDRLGHGTGVASLIAAIAPNARLVDVQVVGDDRAGAGEALVAGLRFALGRRLALVNLSLTCHARFRPALIELCEAAYVRSQIVVAARRNTPLLDEGLPAQLSSCIGVDGARFPTPWKLRFRPGHPIEFTARGDELVVAAPGGKYTLRGGTSYATSTLTGLCALLLGAQPGLTPYEVKAALKAWAGE
jgi:subtilisin family serine protease